jgi:hypothetical protein
MVADWQRHDKSLSKRQWIHCRFTPFRRVQRRACRWAQLLILCQEHAQGSRRIHRSRTTGARRHRLLRLLVNRHLGLTSNNSRRMDGYHPTGKRGGHRYHQRLRRCRARRCLRPRLGRSMHHNLLRHRCHTRHRCGVRRRRNRSMRVHHRDNTMVDTIRTVHLLHTSRGLYRLAIRRVDGCRCLGKGRHTHLTCRQPILTAGVCYQVYNTAKSFPLHGDFCVRWVRSSTLPRAC